jgi:DNA mismatch repair protein MutL
MSAIRILPEHVANKIAAGEVVERPASVVKELLENSLDAGAERIEVTVESGGRRSIRVVDDGCGMNHDDALLAFERHATSKIRSADDLFEISTLGFRGEALPSIAAVSRLVLETRHASEAAGTLLEFSGGKLLNVRETSWPRGTRIEARDLFFNTPGRRKFLKSESTELAHIASLLTHYALAHPEKSFRLTSLTTDILNVAPVASSRDRVYQVMGGQLLEQLVEIAPVERRMLADSAERYGPPEVDEGELVEKPPTVRLAGFVSRPEVERLNRNHIYFFVNRRLVRERLILHAITEAYRNILPGGAFPVALIFLDLPAAEVDVNVHPSKTEVRFRHSGFIHDFVRDSIRQALMKSRPVANFPMSASASATPGRPAGMGWTRGSPLPPVYQHDEAEIGERMGEEQPLAGPPASGFHLSAPQPPLQTDRLPLDDRLAAAPSPDLAGEHNLAELPLSSPGASAVATRFAPAESACQTRLAGSILSAASSGRGEFPADLQPLGQLEDSFIVATNPEGLWIIDQHVAHERILFEQHLESCQERRPEAQRLLLPVIAELSPDQHVAFGAIADELTSNGFEVEPFGPRAMAIKTAPAEIRADDAERLLIEILDGVGPEARAISLDELRGRIAASIACHAAIKVNMPLDQKKMDWLLRELSHTKCPMTCPHGRPIALRYSLKEIQKAFKRI